MKVNNWEYSKEEITDIVKYQPNIDAEKKISNAVNPNSSKAEIEQYYGRILGLSGKVTKQEIKDAYLRLLSKYRPDNFKHLDMENRRIIKQKYNEAKLAIDYFRKKYNF